MNAPLNPVFKEPIPLPKKRAAPRELTRLSMPESHALITWLMSYKMQPGDSLATLAMAASSALKNPRINKNHIQQRMDEFNLELPRRVSNAPVIERLTRLENALTAVIREQARMLRDLGIEPAAEVLEFLD